MKEKINKFLRLANTPTAKNTYLVFIGNSLAGLIGMVLMILISRDLGPAGFGVFSVSFALLTLLSKFGDFGFNFAMVKNISQSRAKGEEQRIKNIFETVFWSKVVVCLVLAAVGYFSADFISIKLFNSPLSSNINKYLMLSFVLFVFYDLVRVYHEANKQFLQSVLMYFISNLIKLVMVIGVIIFWPKIKQHAFIHIYVIGPFLLAFYYFFKSKIKLRLKFSKKEFISLFKFASWMAVSVVFAAIGENLNVFMVSARLSDYQTGIYSAAEKFILPFYIFAGALGTTLIPRASEFLELSHVKSFIKKVLIIQIGFLALCIVTIPLARLLPFLLGSDYSSSVGILQILIIGSFFRVAITPLNSVFYPLNKSVIFALDSVIQVVFLFVFNLGFLPQFQAKGAAYSFLITNIIIFITNYLFLFFVLKHYEKKAISLG